MYIDSKGNKWWKGNLHLHTNVSDGRLSPAEAVELYRSKGYDFIAITDHWKTSETKLWDNGLLVLSGCEYDISRSVTEGIFHITSVGCTEEPNLKRGANAFEMVNEIHRAGGLANLAHPAWSMNTCDMLLPSVNGKTLPFFGADMTEIFNSVSDLPRNCRPYSGDVLDQVAARGYIPNIIATDDTHWYIGVGDGWRSAIAPAMYNGAEWEGESDACRSYIMVKAEECTRDSIMGALSRGDYYATQGPEVEISLEGDTVVVRCSPAEQVVFFTDTAWCDNRGLHGEGITEARFTLRNERFVRAEVRARGKYAWSAYVTRDFS